MQNFTTTLKNDLVNNKRIFLPAGNAKFTLIDASDIGKVASIILTQSEHHRNKSYELTNNEILTFAEMAHKLTIGLGTTIKYQSPNLINFFVEKRKEKTPTMLILVMIMLHYLPRFQKSPKITDCVKQITKNEPKTSNPTVPVAPVIKIFFILSINYFFIFKSSASLKAIAMACFRLVTIPFMPFLPECGLPFLNSCNTSFIFSFCFLVCFAIILYFKVHFHLKHYFQNNLNC